MEGPHMEGPHTEGPHMEGPHMEGPHTEGPHMEGPKKRGRKPKLQKEEPLETEEVRKRKRGRKPKCEITSIQDIREKFKDSDDKVIFHGSSEPIETNLEQVQVPFGNLNITVHTTTKTVDKDELRTMYTKQTAFKPIPKTQEESDDDSDGSDGSETEEIPRILRKVSLSDDCTTEKDWTIDSPKQEQPTKKYRAKLSKLLFHISEHIKNTKEWPETCDSLCWWCCHPFGGIPIPCVSKYDSIRKRFKVYGIFCSWECSAAFGFSENNSLLNLLLLKRNWTGDSSNISKAPSRYLLQSFGGGLTIDEFRNSSNNNKKYHISVSSIDFVSQNVIETYNTQLRDYEVKVKCKPIQQKTSFFGN